MMSSVRIRVRASGGLGPFDSELEVPIAGGAAGIRDAAVAAFAPADDVSSESATDGRLLPGVPYRVLSAGKFLPDSEPLSLRPGSRVMLMPPLPGAQALQQLQQQQEVARDAATRTERLVAAAKRMAKREGSFGGRNEEFRFELTDQDGRPVELPQADVENLKAGMVLFEKGSALLRGGEVQAARELLVEADSAFAKVDNALLESIDNYAVLQLNLCWCFLQLRESSFLAEAKNRLRDAERILERAHGQSLERLLAVRGVTGPSLILYLRLHLLKGVVYFYEQRKLACEQSLAVSADLLKELSVDDGAMAQLQDMGFTEREARLGLRAAKTVEPAAAHILLRREKLAERQREERERRKQERKQERRARRYGKTANGSLVDLGFLRTLRDMGFSKQLAIAALRQVDNDVMRAQQLLIDDPETLQLAIAAESAPGSTLPTSISGASLAQVEGMGFPHELALGTLQSTNGNVERALELLLSDQGIMATESDVQAFAGLDTTISANATEANATEAASEDEEVSEAAEDPEEIQRKADEELLVHHLDLDDEAYLDASLQDERNTLAEFLQAVGTLRG